MAFLLSERGRYFGEAFLLSERGRYFGEASSSGESTGSEGCSLGEGEGGSGMADSGGDGSGVRGLLAGTRLAGLSELVGGLREDGSPSVTLYRLSELGCCWYGVPPGDTA